MLSSTSAYASEKRLKGYVRGLMSIALERKDVGDLEISVKGRPVVPGLSRGEALVSEKPLSFLGGVDAETGIVIEKNHDLNGKSLKGAILCFPYSHGSTVGSYVLYSLVKKNVGPRAIINEAADPVVVVGAVIGEIPMVDRVHIGQIKTGDLVEVDGGTGTVKIMRGTRPYT